VVEISTYAQLVTESYVKVFSALFSMTPEERVLMSIERFQGRAASGARPAMLASNTKTLCWMSGLYVEQTAPSGHDDEAMACALWRRRQHAHH
jgi:hypothetical protein